MVAEPLTRGHLVADGKLAAHPDDEIGPTPDRGATEDPVHVDVDPRARYDVADVYGAGAGVERLQDARRRQALGDADDHGVGLELTRPQPRCTAKILSFRIRSGATGTSTSAVSAVRSPIGAPSMLEIT